MCKIQYLPVLWMLWWFPLDTWLKWRPRHRNRQSEVAVNQKNKGSKPIPIFLENSRKSEGEISLYGGNHCCHRQTIFDSIQQQRFWVHFQCTPKYWIIDLSKTTYQFRSRPFHIRNSPKTAKTCHYLWETWEIKLCQTQTFVQIRTHPQITL